MLSIFNSFNVSMVANAGLVACFLIFIILLKIRSFKLSKTWFVPIFAIYFGVYFAALFGIFFDGPESSKLLSNNSVLDLIIKAFNPANRIGKVMYGGFFGSIVGSVFASLLLNRKSLSDFLDISAISITLSFAIWRIGCFLGGCCYGMPGQTFGMRFYRNTIAYVKLRDTPFVKGEYTVPLLPTQLISASGNFAIFLFLLILFCKNKTRYPYFYFFAQALLYGIGRFIIEFFRMDPRGFWGPLSVSQWFALVMIAVSLVFFIKNRKEISESFKNPSRNF